MPMRNRNRATALAMGLTAALAVQGCAEGMPRLIAPKPATPPVEQVVVPQPQPAVAANATATAQSRKATTAVTRTAPPPKPALKPLPLSVTYFVRLMVPVGSTLSLRADPAGGGAPALKQIETTGGPPYTVELPVNAAAGAFPMTVTATLQSTIGHTLTGTVTLDAMPTGATEIVLTPSTDG